MRILLNKSLVWEHNKKCLLLHIPKLFELKANSKWEAHINLIAMGLFSLSHQLDVNGFEPEIIHIAMEKYYDTNFSIVKYIKKQKIKFIGISLHWHFQAYDTIEIAKKIKQKNPNTFIFLGGYTASCYADEIIEKMPFIDAIIKGEGEGSIVELAKRVTSDNYNFEGIPNLYWRKNGEVVINPETYVASSEDLNKLSFYSQLDNLKHNQFYFYLETKIQCLKNNDENIWTGSNNKQIHTICFGRGCSGNCTWCGGGADALKKILNRNCISWRSPHLVADEIFMLKRVYGIEEFYFCFDPTPSDQSKICELFRLLGESKEKINLNFECFRLPTDEFIKEFKSNLSANSIIVISPEFGNEDLRKLHKSFYFSNKELEDTLRKLYDLKITSVIFFASIPDLSKEEEQNTIDYANYLKEKYQPFIHVIIIPINDFEPGAPWTENPLKYGMNYKNKIFMDFYNENSVVKESWESQDFIEKF